ncbi:hypothetical protein Tsubulata_023712 [Turnera subulata]|uniref:Uncharacterized protein n=1 Tax=Turnera subulata TaxID=218843 RepID=A0A9Q0FN41_9ROSI|nr:hypothetical protein Tsubulata_023712 [Turnera subulata]
MSTLQKYYGLRSPNHKNAGEGTEMAVYRSNRTGSSDDLSEALLPKSSPMSGPPYRNHRRRSSSNIFLPENGEGAEYMPLAEAGDAEGEKSNEKSVRRRQKAEADSKTATPEKFLNEENFSGRTSFSPVTGKGLAMRPKSASRTSLAPDTEAGWLNSIPVGMGDSIITDGPVGVRKSSSTPTLQDSDNSNSSSVWPPAKWNLKPDLQALSNAAITIPIFDGLPKPISGRRSKAALD